MNLDQFKDALIRTIYKHLHTVSQDERFYLLLDIPQRPEAAALELTPTQWRLISSLDPTYDRIRDNDALKPVYISLFKLIIQAEQGHNLWKDIQAETSV